jgi:dTDP-4-amino-4,6-dideoxygalactose transaminase
MPPSLSDNREPLASLSVSARRLEWSERHGNDRTMSDVPFVDLTEDYRELRAEIDEAIGRVIQDGGFILGRELEAFEKEFAAYCGTRHAIGVGSGLDALTLALQARGIGSGDEVITTANTFIATALAVSRVGATPVFVDCSESDFNLNPDALEKAITPRTRAVIPVHLYGQMASIDVILDWARRHDLFVLEDAAQAHGAAKGGRRAGSFGDAGAYSFYPAKNLGAFGDGGLIVTNDDGLAERIRMLRHYGQRAKYEHEVVGTNSRLDTLQAAVLRVKLKALDRRNEARRAVADGYRRRLARLPLLLPQPPEEPSRHVYHLYVVRVAGRDPVQRRLAAAGIGTGIHYPRPVHLQEAYRDLGIGPGTFPVAERLAGEVLSLPMFPTLSDDQIDRVGSALEEALR